jgi:hypothetical protein
MGMHLMDIYGQFRSFRDIYGIIESYFCRLLFMDVYGYLWTCMLWTFMDILECLGTFMELLRVILRDVVYGHLWTFMDMCVMDVY